VAERQKKNLKTGDRVRWNAGSEGTVTGVVRKRIAKPTKIKSHDVAASPENPEYLVESEKTGAIAAHKSGALRPAPKKRKP
jgi:preprotein translocase subunit YajC